MLKFTFFAKNDLLILLTVPSFAAHQNKQDRGITAHTKFVFPFHQHCQSIIDKISDVGFLN